MSGGASLDQAATESLERQTGRIPNKQCVRDAKKRAAETRSAGINAVSGAFLAISVGLQCRDGRGGRPAIANEDLETKDYRP
jgi:hypothetical protein